MVRACALSSCSSRKSFIDFLTPTVAQATAFTAGGSPGSTPIQQAAVPLQ